MGGSKIVDLKLTISNMMQKSAYQQEQQQRARSVWSREEAIGRCVNSLIHALKCREGQSCTAGGCQKMKRVVEHTKRCHVTQSHSNVRCPICTQLIQLCVYHTKTCRESVCNVPFCRVMKRKLQEHVDNLQGSRTVPQIVIPISNVNRDDHHEPTPKRMRFSETTPQQSSSNVFNRMLETLENAQRQQTSPNNE